MKKTPTTASTLKRPQLTDNPQFAAYKASINYGIVVANKEGKIVDFNQAALDIFGYTEEEFRGHSLTMIMPQRFRDKHTAGLGRYNKTKKPRILGQTLRLFGLHKSGKEFPLELALSSFQEDGEQYFTGAIRKYSALENNLSWILAITGTATVGLLGMLIYFALVP